CTIRETLDHVTRERPTVAVVGVLLSDGSGAEVCRGIDRARAQTAVLMLTAFDWDVYLAEAWSAGAVGFIPMRVDLRGLVEAIRGAAAGARLYAPEQMRRIQDWHVAVGTRLAALTPREREVLTLVSAGKSNREIAELCVLTQNTVEKHVSAVLRKLGVCSRQSLVVFVMDHHLQVSECRMPRLQPGISFLSG
ncbi:MAG: response regulator transcription factor, partial [Chloroflexi bacterium]|nr:response regulator transcription factor [Chloroflexota bacterium]